MTPKEFIEKRYGNNHLAKAREQQNQIRYFIQSRIQEDLSIEYFNQWAQREYRSDDYFFNWLKVILKTENFLTVYKYYRTPGATSGLIQDYVVPQLKRVFYAEDSYFNYSINGKRSSEPEYLKCSKFDSKILHNIVFKYNDILIYDVNEYGEPYDYLVSINNVIAIDSKDSEIHRISFTGEVGGESGFIYIDEEVYEFYNQNHDLILSVPHGLGECPADYLVPDCMEEQYNRYSQDPVRLSMFSHIREKLEDYDFMKTLQRMTEVNGAFPILAKPKTTDNKQSESKDDLATVSDTASAQILTGKVPKPKASPVGPGTIAEIPIPKKTDGSYDMDFVTNFFKFFYVPVEILDYINKRVVELEKSIITRVLGDFSESREDAKNELQVSKGYVVKQDRLREISGILTRIRTHRDKKMLGLQYGLDNVSVDHFYGSDFFLETEDDLYNRFEKSPNTIERKNILVKLNASRYKFNPQRVRREKILYDLLPFVSDKDFQIANTKELDEKIFLYQTRFNYWISQFEAQYGDLVEIWDSMGESKDSEKLVFIDNLVKNLITDDIKTSSPPAGNIRERANV